MIEVKKLAKAFDGAPVLADLDLCVQKGSIYGLIGENGAGKTTVIQLLTGVLKPDSGEITIGGQPIWDKEDVKMKTGLVPDDLYFPLGASLLDMKKYYSKIYSNWDSDYFDQTAANLSLNTKKNLRRFSKGMKKQAYLALTLAAKPDVLFLDEPMDGLDPIVRKTIWHLIIDEVAEREMTVLISSHNLRELEGMCDTIGILSDGKLLMEKDLEEVKHNMYKVQAAFDGKCPAESFDALNILHRESRGSVELLIIREQAETIKRVLGAANPKVLDILPLTLEEIFIYELGGEHDEVKEIL